MSAPRAETVSMCLAAVRVKPKVISSRRVSAVRDLLFLKLLAIPDRPDPVKAMQDRTDVSALLRDNADRISREDISYLANGLRSLVFSREDAQKYVDLIRWLNETLELLGLADRRYQEQESSQP